MKTRKDEIVCPGCGRKEPAEVVLTITPMEAEKLSPREFRMIGTVTCPDCGYWFFSPPQESAAPDRDS